MFCIFSYCSAYIIRLHEIYTYKNIKSILGSQNMIEKGKNSFKKKIICLDYDDMENDIKHEKKNRKYYEKC